MDGTRTSPPNDSDRLKAECDRLAAALALAKEDRQQLCGDIHDGVIQELTAAALLIEDAGRQARFSSPEASERFANGLRLLRESIAESRRLICGTAVEAADDNFVAALDRLVQKTRADLQLPLVFTSAVADVRLPVATQQQLVRIAQESLYNAWKHARASEVEVRLVERGDAMELTIADNGVGFDPAVVPPGNLGLDGIRTRAAAIGAALVFDTAPNHGTRVVVTFRPGGGSTS